MFFSRMDPLSYTTHSTVVLSNLEQHIGDYTMNPEIINMYIDRLIREIGELTKSRLLIETQLQYTEKMNADLQARIKQLEDHAEKQSRKINKKEVSTSEVF